MKKRGTCIAYRDGVLAADTMVVVDDFIKLDNDIKIAKYKGHLFGVSGNNCPTLEAFRKWWFIKPGQQRQAYKKPFSFRAIVILPDGTIEEWDHLGNGDKINAPFWAIGSGREFALGALEFGANAQEAVQAAIKFCPTVGGKVVTRKL